MAWRLARGLITLRDQVNAKWPKRSKDSDGSIGDTSHSARHSDHNPDADGVVHAIDITHDPKGGFDSYAFADMLLHKQDPRLSYVISNRRIGSGPAGKAPGAWRPYTGINPHDHHVHVSIVAGQLADSVLPWDIDGTVAPSSEVIAAQLRQVNMPTLRRGAHGPEVERLQKAIGAPVDGIFGGRTMDRLREFQSTHGIVADGVAGPQTWKLILH